MRRLPETFSPGPAGAALEEDVGKAAAGRVLLSRQPGSEPPSAVPVDVVDHGLLDVVEVAGVGKVDPAVEWHEGGVREPGHEVEGSLERDEPVGSVVKHQRGRLDRRGRRCTTSWSYIDSR